MSDKLKISHEKYASLYGPTTGDRVRLADTELLIEVEKDYTTYGDEAVFGGGKVIREGMGMNPLLTRDEGVPDLVLTNALIIDYTGIYKADIGIRDGKIFAIGKAGNDLVMDNVTFPIGISTEVISAEGKIVTAGGIDSHIHFISPTQIEAAAESGITTMLGGGTGPTEGTNATTDTPGAWNIERMLQAAEGLPMNIGFLGKGQGANLTTMAEQIEAGAIGLKVHEDWGATAAAIDNALKVADKYDVQVALHTDTLNEGGFVERTIAAIGGRTIHTYHTEGAGGGHAPDIIKVAGELNILPSSTSPTMPFTSDTLDEHLDMLMATHHLNPAVPEDVAFADSRIREETIAAEDVLQDMGIISMMSSDSQAMGRVGEVIMRTWQTANKMKQQFGALAEDQDQHNDNYRVKRYISKYTINPAITHGVSDYVGSIEVGKIADLVLWSPAFFGVKPDKIVKGGMINLSLMGDANASIPLPEPVQYRKMFGAFGRALQKTSCSFVSKASLANDIAHKYGLQKTLLPVHNIRKLTKKNMKFNDGTPTIQVDPQTYEVTVDGKIVTCQPATELALTQKYFLF